MSFGNFHFQGPMPSFQFRKMRFYGHIGLLSQSRWAGRPSSSARTAVCHSCIQSRVCLATAKLYGANFREVLLFQHRFTSEVGAGARRRPTFVSVGRPFQTAGAEGRIFGRPGKPAGAELVRQGHAAIGGSPRRPGRRTQRIKARLLFVVQRIVEFRELGLHRLHCGKRGLEALLHRLDPAGGRQRLVGRAAASAEGGPPAAKSTAARTPTRLAANTGNRS